MDLKWNKNGSKIDLNRPYRDQKRHLKWARNRTKMVQKGTKMRPNKTVKQVLKAYKIGPKKL